MASVQNEGSIIHSLLASGDEIAIVCSACPSSVNVRVRMEQRSQILPFTCVSYNVVSDGWRGISDCERLHTCSMAILLRALVAYTVPEPDHVVRYCGKLPQDATQREGCEGLVTPASSTFKS